MTCGATLAGVGTLVVMEMVAARRRYRVEVDAWSEGYAGREGPGGGC